MIYQSPKCLWLAIACTAVLGCGGGGKNANVTGTVLINGDLAKRGTVTFHSDSGGPLAVGQIRADGSYSIRVGQGNRSNADASMIPAGKYKVTVVVTGPPKPSTVPGGPPHAGPRLMDSRYGTPDTTDLVVEVKSGKNLFVFDLDPATPMEEDQDEEADPEAPSEGDPATTSDSTGDSTGDQEDAS